MNSSGSKHKKIILPLIFLVISLAGWTGGVLISLYGHENGSLHVDKEHFERVLQEADKELVDNILLIHKKISENEAALPSLMNSLSDNEFSYFVYHKDTLIGWSDASVPVTDEKGRIFRSRIIRLKNGWYLIERRQFGDHVYAGLFRIKQEYEYQNKFLKNSFSKRFKVSSNPEIVTNSPDKGIAIFDKNGEYLFSLVKNQTLLSTTKTAKTGLLFIIIALIGTLLFLGSTLKYLVSKTGNYAFVIIATALFLLYWGFVNLNATRLSGMNELFSPVLFAYTSWFPSLFSMLFLAVTLHSFFFWIYRYYTTPGTVFDNKGNSRKTLIYFIIAAILLLSYLMFINWLIMVIVKHSSSISLYYRVTDLDITAVSKIVTITLLLFSFLFFAEKVISEFSRHIPLRTQILIFSILSLSGIAVSTALRFTFIDVEFILFFVVSLILAVIHKKRNSSILTIFLSG